MDVKTGTLFIYLFFKLNSEQIGMCDWFDEISLTIKSVASHKVTVKMNKELDSSLQCQCRVNVC